MLEPDGSPNTAHSLNPVPVIVTMPGLTLRDGGVLADVAPTILQLLGYEQPAAMTGHSLIRPSPDAAGSSEARMQGAWRTEVRERQKTPPRADPPVSAALHP